ncbi:hypothetical protein [Chitinimonas naiadis]
MPKPHHLLWMIPTLACAMAVAASPTPPAPSAFTQYQAWQPVPQAADWREANARVTALAGHAGHSKAPTATQPVKPSVAPQPDPHAHHHGKHEGSQQP